VAEKADWLSPVLSEAKNALDVGDTETAVIKYMMAAERGYEIAQSNLAYMIDRGIALCFL